MDEQLDRPVHLYVKRHLGTGLKYLGRTVEDPYTYPGSGTYWLAHVKKFGDYVETKVIGTYVDRESLQAAAKAYSTKHRVSTSTKWANLLPEDGGASGEGWHSSQDFRARIAELDAAVRRRVLAASESAGSASSPRVAETHANRDAREKRAFMWSLALVTLAAAIIAESNNRPGDGYADDFPLSMFLFGACISLVTPAGWIPAAIVTWVYLKMTD